LSKLVKRSCRIEHHCLSRSRTKTSSQQWTSLVRYSGLMQACTDLKHSSRLCKDFAAIILLIRRTAGFGSADTEGRCTRGEDPAQFGLSGHSSSPMHGGGWTALQGWALHGNVSQSGASRQELQVDDSLAVQQLQVQDACCSSSHRCSMKRPSPANLCIPVWSLVSQYRMTHGQVTLPCIHYGMQCSASQRSLLCVMMQHDVDKVNGSCVLDCCSAGHWSLQSM